jgi:hypothetical protein
MLKRPRPVPCQQEKDGYADIRDKVEWQQNYKLGNLAEREWRIHRRLGGLSKPADRVAERVIGYGPVLANQILEASVYENSIEYVDLRFVDEESLEEQSNHSCPFTKNKECAVDPSAASLVENGQEGDLWQVRPKEKVQQYKHTESNSGNKTCPEHRIEIRVHCKEDQSLLPVSWGCGYFGGRRTLNR